MEKICIKCNLVKNIYLFVKTKNSCKECESIYKKEHRLKNKELIKSKSKKYYLDNKDSIKSRMSSNYENGREKKLEYQKKYASLNKEKISKYKMEYQRNRRKTDPVFKMKYVVARLIRNSFKTKGLSKNKKTIDILGCDIEFFKIYIEEKFIDDMNWSNHGVVWDIDHIIPLTTAKDEKDVIILNHYSNLQPLDSYINRNIKRDRLDF